MEKVETSKTAQAHSLDIADVMGSTPKEKWENLKRYIIKQTDKIDKETEWRPNEPEWWLEMSTIARNVRQYCFITPVYTPSKKNELKKTKKP